MSSSKLKSRKFWIAVITSVAMAAGAFTGADLDIEEIAAILTPAVAFIAGESYNDAKKIEKGG